jgi:DNA-binding CsgD family transcriptional regulator
MLAVSALNECLLDLALQRNIAGFQQALKRTMELFSLSAWAVIFPPGSVVGGRPVLMAQGIRTTGGPLLALAAKNGLESIFPPQGVDEQFLSAFVREINPEPKSRVGVLRDRREKGGEFLLFCFRPPTAADFAPDDLVALSRVARVLDRCFLALAESQEQEFEAGLFRLIGNLHPEGLCVLDNRLRVIFENRRFREQMHVWNNGLVALKKLSVPRQSELPTVWRETCDRSFQAFRQLKLPPVNGRMVVTQGSLSTLRKTVDDTSWLDGAVRYLAFQSALGVRPYLVLTCGFRTEQSTAGQLSLARIAEKHRFSRRETELAELILRGSSAREIAAHLKIALPTVKTHIRHILHKTGVKTRLQFAGLCRPQG